MNYVSMVQFVIQFKVSTVKHSPKIGVTKASWPEVFLGEKCKRLHFLSRYTQIKVLLSRQPHPQNWTQV